MMCLTDVNLHVRVLRAIVSTKRRVTTRDEMCVFDVQTARIYVKFIPCDSRENDLRTVVRIQNSNCVGIVSERAKRKQNLQIVLGSEEENA